MLSLHPVTLNILPAPTPIESRVFGYVRVSTIAQYERGSSIETQEALIRDYCKSQGLVLQHIYKDVFSGKNIDDRVDFTALLSNLRFGDIYIFASITRFGRNNQDNINTFNLMKTFNCRVVILDMNVDTSTLWGETIFGITSVMAETERKLIAERTSAVMQHMIKEGTLRRKPAFGYKIELSPKGQKFNKTVPHPEEQLVVDYIRRLIVAYPTIRIADILRSLQAQSMTLRKGKLTHQGIKDIIIRENLREDPTCNGRQTSVKSS